MIRIFFEGFDWTGRTARGLFAAVFVSFFLVASISIALMETQAGSLRIVGVCLCATLIVPFTGYQIRRFHDTGRSGAWVLLSLIPYVGILVSIYLLFARSSEADWRRAPKILTTLGYGACVALTGLVLTMVFWKPYWIPSGSMKPTLLIGDYLIVSLGISDPARGEVRVFRHPRTDEHFVARLIGLPGDRVQMRGGALHINGAPTELESVGFFVESDEPTRNRCYERREIDGEVKCVKQALKETLPNGVTYTVLNASGNDGPLDNTREFVVPEGHFFFMGDNRDNSNDSRLGVGMVLLENLVGRVEWVLFSSAGHSQLEVWNWRPNRYFQRIQ